MKHLILPLWTICSLLLNTCNLQAATNNVAIPAYDIKCAGVGVEGTYLAEISIYLSKPDKNVQSNLQKAAIHGVLFHGISPSSECDGQKAIITNTDIENKHKEFFITFFSDITRYSRYANVITRSIRVNKIEKKRYRITAVVSIQKEILRKMLEQEDIIEGFKDLF